MVTNAVGQAFDGVVFVKGELCFHPFQGTFPSQSTHGQKYSGLFRGSSGYMCMGCI